MFGVKTISKGIGNMVGRRAYNASIAASKAANIGVGRATPIAMNAATSATSAAMKRSTRQARMIVGGSAVAASTAMRPNADQSRTSYRGPTQTGRGVGRYA